MHTHLDELFECSVDRFLRDGWEQLVHARLEDGDEHLTRELLRKACSRLHQLVEKLLARGVVRGATGELLLQVIDDDVLELFGRRRDGRDDSLYETVLDP